MFDQCSGLSKLCPHCLQEVPRGCLFLHTLFLPITSGSPVLDRPAYLFTVLLFTYPQEIPNSLRAGTTFHPQHQCKQESEKHWFTKLIFYGIFGKSDIIIWNKKESTLKHIFPNNKVSPKVRWKWLPFLFIYNHMWRVGAWEQEREKTNYFIFSCHTL